MFDAGRQGMHVDVSGGTAVATTSNGGLANGTLSLTCYKSVKNFPMNLFALLPVQKNYKQATALFSSIYSHSFSRPFKEAEVSTHGVINLNGVKKKLETYQYSTFLRLVVDLSTIWTNCHDMREEVQFMAEILKGSLKEAIAHLMSNDLSSMCIIKKSPESQRHGALSACYPYSTSIV